MKNYHKFPKNAAKNANKGSNNHASHGAEARLEGRAIMGRNCILEVLREIPGHINQIFYVDSDGNDRHQEILTLAQRNRIDLSAVSETELTKLVGSDSHQGFVAEVREGAQGDFKSFVSEYESVETGVVLLLDDIQDPQNLGAILRAAECFGVDAVFWSKNRGASLTPAASKASVGGSELVRAVPVANLVDAAMKLKEIGYWLVGAEVGEGVQDIYEFEFPQKVAIALGSEESGLQALLSKRLDFRVKIPMFGKIDSLNVSQAAAVFLAMAKRKIA